MLQIRREGNETATKFEYNGLAVNVIRSDRKTISLKMKPSELIMRVPVCMSDKEIQTFLVKENAWIEKHRQLVAEEQKQRQRFKKLTPEELNALEERARRIIPEKVRRYAAIIGVDYGRITIRHQRTRWGSCSSKGNLNFNCLLMLAPDEVTDSVVAHELCHRKHMDHSGSFYAELERACPEYQRCRRWLNENGGLLLSRLP